MTAKSELTSKIATKIDFISAPDVTLAVKEILRKMAHALALGSRIEIRDFGAFQTRLRKSRLARNPKTGVKLYTKPKHTVHFKQGKGMKERVNNV
jgi:integration host factor subunit beta